ncbi:Fe(2+)/2-oxoglutarate-dependent oxygenase encD [Aspergillus homomorphus CBS 101889]|uniref:Clavaminate synthase-like protein n=1 Tax=Aspergillus homomorphus (strain CBS 101889) TaxID=1450537 RepID=A0A395HN78_ASPHC|nr:Clavaminate synthase-like protein [Aspergillus homomorphus CBS 101889]RAL09402.1 Clavaminate synthase-like protein [Aspergillus homomorphus CBS 101889]
MSPNAPPVLDFSVFYGNDTAAKAKLIDQLRECCHYNGFFQITGHRVPRELQQRVMGCARRFFDLPLEEKLLIDKNRNSFNRGYELLRSQMLEVGTGPELKEGLYIGEEIPEDHPYFLQKKLNSGPNQWPPTVPDKDEFEQTSMEYYHAVFDLAKNVLGALALTLNVSESYFDPLTDGAVATMRYLHYPAQPKDAEEKLNRGIGAHTDFGCITLLLQDEVDGLQVLDAPTGEWLDVEPVPGAYVVNLGNLFMRMANDRYKSNIHRVINKSGQERYSIPFFFSGNPDYLCECLPHCRQPGEGPKYPPITVEQMVTASYKESYGRAEKYKQEIKAKMEVVATRYTLITLGGPSLAFTLIRSFVFTLSETPRYSLSKGRDQAAVDAVKHVARQNGKPEPLTLSMFQDIDNGLDIPSTTLSALLTTEILRGNMEDFTGSHYRALVGTRSLTRNTFLIWGFWLTIGIAYPLYFNSLPSYLATKFSSSGSLDTTYRNYCIESAVGVSGPLSAAYLVTTFFGRRWMMGLSAIVTGVFLFAYAGVSDAAALLAFARVTRMLGDFDTLSK